MCSSQRYRIWPAWPESTLQGCEKCPRGLICSDGSCAIRDNMTACADASDLIIGEWRQPVERGTFELHSCPEGFSKRGLDRVQREFMQCQRCADRLNYIIEPDRDDCQRCPPGLTCHGNALVEPVVNGSEWVLEESIFRLVSCPPVSHVPNPKPSTSYPNP
jgi:hypothetical protein